MVHTLRTFHPYIMLNHKNTSEFDYCHRLFNDFVCGRQYKLSIQQVHDVRTTLYGRCDGIKTLTTRRHDVVC